MVKNNIGHSERLMLKGSLRKEGYESWRLVTNAVSTSNGAERTFFFEFYIVNPAIAPKEVVLGYKNRFGKTAADLQYALAGTESAQTATSQNFVHPSFTMVRAGYYGAGGKQVSAYFPFGETEIGKNDFVLRVAKETEQECVISADYCFGKLKLSKRDCNAHPEYLCNSGEFAWNLNFDRKLGFKPDYNDSICHWAVISGKCECEGKIIVDDEEFIATTMKSCGYFDKNWGKDFPNPFIHLSSSNVTSLITGKTLTNSCFAVQGKYGEKLSVLTSIEDLDIEFHVDKNKNYEITFDCSEAPEDEDGSVKLHWTVSVHDKKHVIDIDIFCATDQMFLRSYESPKGARKVLKVLGGSGSGELRVYKKTKKTLELLEHVSVHSCVAEYGNIEYPEE